MRQISQYPFPLESGNCVHLEQTKFPVFWQHFQILCVFPDSDFFLPFSLFSLCRGYPVDLINYNYKVNVSVQDKSVSV